jgi:HEAT repeat protein
MFQTMPEKKPKNQVSKDQKLTTLLEKLTARDFRSKNEAIKGLGKLNHQKAQEALYNLIENAEANEQLRVSALDALGRKGKDKRFLNMLVKIPVDLSQPRELRRACITHLARYRDVKYVGIFKEVLLDDYRFIRKWAVRGLLKIHDRKATVALIHALGDADEEIRKDVQSHLELAGKDYIPEIVIAFNDPEANKFLRYGAAGLFGRIGTKEATDALIGALKDGNPRVVTIAIRGIGKSPEVKSIKPLIQLLKKDNEKKRLIQDALYKIGKEHMNILMLEITPLLLEKDEICSQVTETLIEKLTPYSIVALNDIISLDDTSAELKKAIKNAMEKIKN